MKLEAASIPIIGWLTAVANAGQQITGSWQLGLWLLAGALCGAGTAVLFPSPGDASLARKWGAAFLAAIGLTMAVFVWWDIDATTDRVFAAAWAAGTVAWLAVPILQRGGIKRLRDWLGGRPNG
jgi:hypothetical protein